MTNLVIWLFFCDSEIMNFTKGPLVTQLYYFWQFAAVYHKPTCAFFFNCFKSEFSLSGALSEFQATWLGITQIVNVTSSAGENIFIFKNINLNLEKLNFLTFTENDATSTNFFMHSSFFTWSSIKIINK